MPIKTIDLQQAPGFLVQVCAACGAEHTIAFDRGAAETKPGPFKLAEGVGLELAIDGKTPVALAFASGDAKDLGATTASELAKKLQGVAGITARATPAGSVLVESASTGANSRVEVTGGSARAALGFPVDVWDPSPGRPILGVASGGRFENPDLIALRRCGCGSFEQLGRAWDVAPTELVGTSFYEHRRAVNALGEHFKAQGWVHPDLASRYQAEPTPPPDCWPATTKQISVVGVAKAVGKPG